MSCGAQNTPCINPTSSDCVLYNGESTKDICNGSNLTTVIKTLIDMLNAAITNISGDTLSLDTLAISCQSILALVKNKTLNNILSAIITQSCVLEDRINNIDTNVGSVNINSGCLSAPNNSSVSDILQLTINNLCTLNTTVENIKNNISNDIDEVVSNRLSNSLNSCAGYGLTKSGSGDNFNIQFSGFVPPFCPIPYFGPTSNFDNTGRGIANTAFCGWFICNGDNGTPDLRGRALVGAINVQGARALDAAVDPANIVNGSGNVNYNVGDRFGENFTQLNVNQMPTHTHSSIGGKHSHKLFNTLPSDGDGNRGWGNNQDKATASWSSGRHIGNQDYDICRTNGVQNPEPNVFNSSTEDINIEISSAGGNLPHNNRQPSVACIYIMRTS